jgi:D-tyrosyl-tRNA(Tyr) deacylase
MRAVVQRVRSASVSLSTPVSEVQFTNIGKGFLILLGVGRDDTTEDATYLAGKIAGLRVFEDADSKMSLSLTDVGGSALVVSNFTLFGDCRKGRRPSFTDAAPGALAEQLYELFGATVAALGVETEYGMFGADMQVALVNDGPVTILLDSRKQF